MTNPLNPELFHALKSRFTDVRIANEGQPCIVRPAKDWKTGAVKDEVVDSGEYYCVDCPYCSDRKGRLWVNHCWNTNRNGRTFGRHLIVCYNEQCDMRNFEFELMPFMRTSGLVVSSARETTPDEYQKSLEMREVALPGRCLKLSDLPSRHPALDYICGRGFDPVEFENLWGVQYCVDAGTLDNDGHIPGTTIFGRLITNRLIIPAYWKCKLIGWQSRAINDYSEPKYYTMPDFKKRLMLYNGDQAALEPMVVIVEGFMKCARVGTMSVALLGKSLSAHQAGLVTQIWGTKPVCILMDPGAEEDALEIKEQLSPAGTRENIFIATPPDDPDRMPREILWDVVRAAASASGVSLPC